MKMVIIAPVVEPKSFADVGFTTEQYKAAAKVGQKKVPAVVAKEAIKNSKGLYRVLPTPEEVAETPRLPDPADMSNEALFAEMSMYGKAPQKRMARSKVIEFVRELRAQSSALIVDDADE
jgi:hypothetical protein